MAHLNKLKPFVPGLAGYGQSLSPLVCCTHRYVQRIFALLKSFFRSGCWISGHLLHQRVDWEEPAAICSHLQQVGIFRSIHILVVIHLLLPRKYTSYKERDM